MPSFEEAGVAGFRAAAFVGIVAPMGTPAEAVAMLAAAVGAAVADAGNRQRLEEMGSEMASPEEATPAGFAAFLVRESAWTRAAAEPGGAAAGLNPGTTSPSPYESRDLPRSRWRSLAWTPPPRRRYTRGTMTWVDAVVLAVLAVSALLAFMRGLVQEVLGVGAWIGAALVALALYPRPSPLLQGSVEPAWLANALAAGGVFLVVLVVLKIIISFVARFVQDLVLGGTDRALGLVFGIARGAFLVILAYILGGMVLPAADRWPEAVRDARMLPLVVDGSHWVVAQLPPEYRPRVAAPPARGGPTQDDLMRPPARNRT